MINALKTTIFLLLVVSLKAYSWNYVGHRLIAQIAYDYMTKNSKQLANRYNHALDTVYKPQSLVNAAPWLDSLHGPEYAELKKKHYIDLPFSWDGTKLLPPDKVNAVTAIVAAKDQLQAPQANNFDKGFNLRILLHVIGDIHQPLHAASQYSKAHLRGDKGGNLLFLAKNSIAVNLHSYWDKGGGFLSGKSYSNKQIQRKARAIEKRWPCKPEAMTLNPQIWTEESHQLAVEKAYLIKAGQKPDKNYQYMVKRITEKQIALAGCRLAATLNSIFEHSSANSVT
ncbi:S1/P1 Nuclease [Legionella massiliensis]|uniref:S1/P1 Nuclease n=1 Tax=Legionella massiliensis TaxID=1034943 RepID=A0A078KYX4_9GAMM|nr:S1/P1 nuclease [Legionella massiliensis]CDZ78267.1 S1/P1 Nuclease [Legionella massiliensis]CEE14005.1 S1/P1 Nuclease [Legionella massiliensis]